MPDSIYNIPGEVIDSLRKAALLIAKEKVSELTTQERSELDDWLRENSKHGEWLSDLSNHQYLWEELRLYERSQQRAASSYNNYSEKDWYLWLPLAHLYTGFIS